MIVSPSGSVRTTSGKTVYLLSSIRRLRRKTLSSSRRTVPAAMLLFVAEGRGVLHVDQEHVAIDAPQWFFLAPGMKLQADVHSPEIEYYVIVLEPITIAKRRGRYTAAAHPGSLEPPPELSPGRLPIRDIGQGLLRTKELYAAYQAELAGHAQSQSDIRLQGLLDYLRHDLTGRQTAPSAETGVEACIAYMHQHYAEKLSRETLADRAKLTPNAFCRSFKRTTGHSPTDYLNQIRIHHAKAQLSPALPVKEVAAAVGFSSEYYFSRIFKKYVGLSPTHFIKRERLKVAAASRCAFQDHFSSIGTEAVAAVDCYRYPWMDEAEYARTLSSQLEQLRLAKPDLIVGDFFHRDLYDTLKEIAPTVILQHDLNWRAALMQIADLVGREKEALQAERRLSELVDRTREQLGRFVEKETLTVLQVIQDVVRIQGTVHHPLNELLYAELGFRPGNAVPRNKMREELTVEEFPPLETDHLFIIRRSQQPQVEALLSRLRQTPAWASMQAKANPGTHLISNWLLLSWTPRGRELILRELAERLTGSR
ncbi:helix-turn-helix domain-containing protein [Paenibacillus chartarius]|uniref:Helix-turn-helix domain-containing protein n=1 Tax=Paenibacillus chartarius TaxID=747481 RepID=A0ABV6DT52_9BACL